MLILYDFVKIPQSFFVPKKMTAPFTREPLTAGRALSLRSHIFSVLIKQGAESQASATHSASKTSAGVFQSRHFLGRWLIRSTTLSTVS